MEDIGSEVSHKIRAAIKAKLIELGVYIDGELPDYIMVMVANKRSRQQMNEDLQLFLGSNTKFFTTWLYTVLQKLQEVTIANFDPKDIQLHRVQRRKRSYSDDSYDLDSDSFEEEYKMDKKHVKKVKDEKKFKKSKYKAKEKEKDKSAGEKKASTEFAGNDKQKKPGGDKGARTSHGEPAGSPGNRSANKVRGENEDNSSYSSVSKVPGKVDYSNGEHEGTSAKSSSPSHYSDVYVKHTFQNESEEEYSSMEDEEMKDEFDIEPLKKTKRQSANEKFVDKPNVYKSESQSILTAYHIKAPTRELLREHDKIISFKEKKMLKMRKKLLAKSDDSAARDVHMRPQNILPKSETPGKMKSHASDAQVLKTSSKGKEETTFSTHKAKRISQRRDHDVEEDENIYNRDGSSSNPFWEKSSPKDKNEGENSRGAIPSTSEPKSNIISISKSLEMEKNLGNKSQENKKNSGNKTTSDPKKKPVSSRIVTIPEPETPEIPSVIKVKPREFVPKEKQANKVLILKAVADAEKSIATVQTRNDTDIEPKKSEALFTKNLRGKGKRYEKLAVTLSNVKAGGSVANRVKSKRVVSVDSENANAQDRKTESLKDSEQSQGLRSVPELTLKNISSKSEDQFISSKTSAMEKNDKYIHCWLEGVEKAVKDEEIVNPSDMDDFLVSFSGQEKDYYREPSSSEEDVISENENENDDEESLENEKSADEISDSPKENIIEIGPQIVVTLDGLTSKTLKDIIFRNKEIPTGPLICSTSRRNAYGEEFTDEVGFSFGEVDFVTDAGPSKQSDNDSPDKGNKVEKISERFGRINKTSENHEFKDKYYEFERERYEKKYLKYRGTDKEKHYEKLKDKYANESQSKNKKLIARLSEKFGKVDREFDDKKRKYSDDDLRYSYYKKDGKSAKRDRNSVRSEKPK